MIWIIEFATPHRLASYGPLDAVTIRACIAEHVAMAVRLVPGEYDITPTMGEFTSNHIIRVHDDGTAMHYSIPRYSEKFTIQRESAADSLEIFDPPSVIEMQIPDEEQIVLLGHGDLDFPNIMQVYCIIYHTFGASPTLD